MATVEMCQWCGAMSGVDPDSGEPSFCGGCGYRLGVPSPALAGPVACAWCRKLIRPGDDRLPTSHGICSSCVASSSVGQEAPPADAGGASHA
jgi:hypothetical protein